MTERPAAAVLGLNLVGASLALALHESDRFSAIRGWDPDFDTARAARRRKVAGQFTRRPQDAVQGAAIVFVDVPPGQLRDLLTAIGPHLRPGAVLCTLAHPHEAVANLAPEVLPRNVSCIAGHVVLWEKVGPQTVPAAGIFRLAVFALSPLPEAHPDAIAYLADLAGVLSMEPYFVGAREHDAFFAGIARLPAVLAAALLRVATGDPSWRELSRLAGAAFRHGTALSEWEPARQQEAMVADRDHTVRWLDAMVAELSRLRDMTRDGQEPADFFIGAADARLRWLRNRQMPVESEMQVAVPAEPKRGSWMPFGSLGGNRQR